LIFNPLSGYKTLRENSIWVSAFLIDNRCVYADFTVAKRWGFCYDVFSHTAKLVEEGFI
jgi:hypothetical protein